MINSSVGIYNFSSTKANRLRLVSVVGVPLTRVILGIIHIHWQGQESLFFFVWNNYREYSVFGRNKAAALDPQKAWLLENVLNRVVHFLFCSFRNKMGI
jgi:hypothetical protein